MTDIGSDEAGKENLTDLTNPDLMTEHVDQHIENNEVEHSVKIPKTLSLEYMRNKKMIELTERNVKYVFFMRNIFCREICFLIYISILLKLLL